MDWTPFSIYSNWCYIDQLGQPGTRVSDGLKTGDVLDILWPDGSITTEQIEVVKSSYTVSDMGTPCQITTREIYVTIKHRGADIRVRPAICRCSGRRV